ncbi:hypothetical protein HLASF_1146 [Halanaeroarchaeum sulfurireducens]|uniref:Uncharacterized protein n=1 Tax=Halanaeroarchaeum sulfurireducens TaxID=1604004 RepID=A0A0F7PDA0_9EURY|nr:hypothetical protein HLASF_1146 [Halanaeroarchaeum sulfurireducens]ALG82030.1 hypothetical protein HLASA_1135 [Halanaeroarchaeum sulfurireducens]
MLPLVSVACTRTRTVVLSIEGTVQVYVPSLVSPVAIVVHVVPPSGEYARSIPSVAMPPASVAVQRMSKVDPPARRSPPFGWSTVTEGAVVSAVSKFHVVLSEMPPNELVDESSIAVPSIST